MGLAGEQHVCNDNTVWITKTHWPVPTAPFLVTEQNFTFDRVIVITRNPIDVLPSWFLLMNTFSHSKQVEEKFHEAFPVEWDRFVRMYTNMFKRFHEFYINQIARNVPIYFFRYEDKTNRNLDTL